MDMKLNNRQNIMDLHESMAQHAENLGEDPFPLKHYHIPGVYCRELFIPAGAAIVGKIHRYPHLVCWISGEAVVVSEEGRLEIKAPVTLNSPAGSKRAIYAKTDVLMMTIHHTFQTELEEIEAELIAPTFDDTALIDEMRKLLEVES